MKGIFARWAKVEPVKNAGRISIIVKRNKFGSVEEPVRPIIIEGNKVAVFGASRGEISFLLKCAEFSEAGILPNSDALNAATEPFSPVGMYGKWFSLISVGAIGLWLIGVWIRDILRRRDAHV